MNMVIHGDCIEHMQTIEDESVHAIITDPPYATTQIEWDNTIPWAKWWAEANRICKGVMVMTASQPFTTHLIASNLDNFLYEWIWIKSRCGSPFLAKHQPMKFHENVLVFRSERGAHRYFPQMEEGEPFARKAKISANQHKYGVKEIDQDNDGTRFPRSLIISDQDWQKQQQLHPTQKPVGLMAYLIRTYTRQGEVVLDPFCGSGSTLVAAEDEGRLYVGIEKEAEYVALTKGRLHGKLPVKLKFT